MSEEVGSLLMRVALALGIGLLIGLERGWRTRAARPGSRTAGIRTFGISALLGGVTAALSRGPEGQLTIAGAIVLGSVFVAYTAAMTVFGREKNRATKNFSATATIAAVLTFALGAYAVLGNVYVAAAAAIATAGVLILREALHRWIRRLTFAELRSGLVLLAMTFIALPLLPSEPVGPWGGINLREVWIIAILLAAISFAGYVAVKLMGERLGVLLTSAMGGLVSSTAVIVSNARRAAAGEGPVRLLAGGAAIASAVSFVRVAVLATALDPLLISFLAPALLAAAAAAGAIAVIEVRGHQTPEDQPIVEMRNPFRLLSVLALAASIGVLVVVGRLVHEFLGTGGTIASAAIMGMFDVDPMTVSMTRLIPSLGYVQATYAILVGVTSNVLGKAVLASALGRGRFAMAMWMVTGVSLGAGALAMWVTMRVAS